MRKWKFFSASNSNESANENRNENEKILNGDRKTDKLNKSTELNESKSLTKTNSKDNFNLRNSIVHSEIEKEFETNYSSRQSNQIENIRKNDKNDESNQNDQSDKDNKNDQHRNNFKTNNLPRIPSRFNRKRNNILNRHLHKSRQRRHKFNKLSSIILTSLPLEHRFGKNDHHQNLNNQMNDKIDYRNNHHNQNYQKSKFQNAKNENESELKFFITNRNSTYLQTNSLIKSHRKAKRRKIVHNQFTSSNYKNDDKSAKNKFENISKQIYSTNRFLNQTRSPSRLNGTNQFFLFLTPSLFTFTAFKRLSNQSSESTIFNATNLSKNKEIDYSNENLPLSNDWKDSFSALPLSPTNKVNNLDNDFLSTNITNTSLFSFNQVKDEVENLDESLKFANRLMILIYVIILFSVLILLLRVIYIAILRKLSNRPGRSTTVLSQNSARHSSQLYTQNTFNQTHYSNYNQPGGNSNNSNVNVSTYGRSSEPNSISGGTASFIGTLTGTLIAHNAQLNRNDTKTKKDNNFLDDKIIIIKKPSSQLNRSDSPNAGLNTRPFSRQSCKFINTDLNIISDDFSSSVYVNENESDLNRSA